MSISDGERFLGICRFERPGDLCLLTSFFNGFWSKTLEEWVQQGAPKQILDSSFCNAYFQFVDIHAMRELKTGSYNDRIDIGGGVTYEHSVHLVVPPYESRIIGEDERTITLINKDGKKARVFKDDPERMPMFLDHPVKDRASWEEHKKRLDPNTPERYPSDWNAYVQEINSKSEPTMLLAGSLFGHLREWVGLENLLYMFYDDPSLIEDMMDQICYLETESLKRALKDIRVSCAMFWEDMAYKTGPLISPDMFRKFMMPRYRKITDVLHSNGIDVIFVDSDGDVNKLIPLWLECGVNGHCPLECAAGNDAVALRKKYGKDIILGGNIDKRELLKGKDAIREEVMSKLPFLLETGGYFPAVDHLVPPDVTFENYCYFINTMREVAGMEKLSFQ